MKKFMMALAFVGLGTAAANAQCDEFATPATSDYRIATNSFWSNWYVQVGVDMTVQNPYGANFLGDMWHEGRTYGLDLAVGKWFTPGIGARVKFNWENDIFPHAFRNQDCLAPVVPNCHDGGSYGFFFDTQFNLSNLICGYNPDRVWNLSIFPRAGLIHRCDADSNTPVIGGGIHSSWKINKLLSVYLEGAYNFCTSEYYPYATGHGKGASNGIVTADLGVTFNLGKAGWSKAVSLDDYEALSAEACSKLAALRSQLKSEQAENADLRDKLAKASAVKASVAEKIVAGNSTSVFFNINSAKLNSKKDLINIEAIATAAKNAGAKVVVTGAADSKTGSSAYNQKLSESRAQAVADELVSLGVDRSKIEVRGIGGVNDVAPFNLNRRAIIELK